MNIGIASASNVTSRCILRRGKDALRAGVIDALVFVGQLISLRGGTLDVHPSGSFQRLVGGEEIPIVGHVSVAPYIMSLCPQRQYACSKGPFRHAASPSSITRDSLRPDGTRACGALPGGEPCNYGSDVVASATIDSGCAKGRRAGWAPQPRSLGTVEQERKERTAWTNILFSC